MFIHATQALYSQIISFLKGIPKGLIPKGNLRINSIIPFYVVVNISSNISFLKFDQSLCYFLVVVKIHITTCLRDTVCSFLHYLLF